MGSRDRRELKSREISQGETEKGVLSLLGVQTSSVALTPLLHVFILRLKYRYKRKEERGVEKKEGEPLSMFRSEI